MRRFRTHWLALLGAMMLLSLSVSSAFGHHPTHPDNRGNAVSTFVHELLVGSDEQDEEGEESCEDADSDEDSEGDSDEDTEGDSDEDSEGAEDCEEQDSDEETDEDSDEEGDEEEEQSEVDGFQNHGHCVREVAWNLDEVGGLNENHGGAVSEAARVTCWGDGDDEDSTEEADVEDGDEDAKTAKVRGDRGKSADAHQKAPGKNKAEGRAGGHGNGHGTRHGRGKH